MSELFKDLQERLLDKHMKDSINRVSLKNRYFVVTHEELDAVVRKIGGYRL